MVPLTAPSTPENAPPLAHPGYRRSYTVPTKLVDPVDRSAKGSSIPAESIETLFTHAAARVVSFTAPSTSSRPTSSSSRRASGYGTKVTGTLPWATSAERTIAAGPLLIYRVPSSGVSFLNSGSLLHPILLRSQCWCVDGEGRFVLRIRQDSYYRIELPTEGVENQLKVEGFKDVLSKVLQYEKTPCPFKAGYQVDLLEQPNTQVRRRQGNPPERAKRWKLERIWVSEEAQQRTQGTLEVRTASPSEDDNDRESSEMRDTMEEITLREQSPNMKTINTQELKTIPRPIDFSTARSVTAPPQLLTQSSTTSTAAIPPNAEPVTKYDNPSSSTDSFYSLNGSVSALPPSPPDTDPLSPTRSSHADQSQEFASANRHKRDVSDATITIDTQVANNAESLLVLSEDAQSPSPPPTPTLISDSDDSNDPPWSDALTPPDTFRLRRLPSGSSCRRNLSPMPHPANLFTPPAGTSKRRLSTALIQKTYALLIGPPAHLVALMIRIAARIANDASAAYPYHVSARGRKIPGTWESSGDEEDEWDEDDYGIPLGSVKSDSSSSSASVSSHVG